MNVQRVCELDLEFVMTAHSHETAPTQFIEADGIRFAYRRFGKGGKRPACFPPVLEPQTWMPGIPR